MSNDLQSGLNSPNSDLVLKEVVSHGLPPRLLCIAYDPIQSLIAIGCHSGVIHVYGLPGVSGILKNADDDGAIISMCFIINKGQLLSATTSDHLHLWNLKSFPPQVLASLKFHRERITHLQLPLHTHWCYVGTDKGNIHVVDVNNFKLSNYNIMWNKTMDVYQKSHPGYVMQVVENPAAPNKLLICYAGGGVVMWDCTKKKVEHHYPTYDARHLTWHHEGSLFMCCHGNGALSTWACNQPQAPKKKWKPYERNGEEETLESIEKVEWKGCKTGDCIIFSGGHTTKAPSITITRSSFNVSTLKMPSAILDFVVLCSTPYPNAIQDPVAVVVLMVSDVLVLDLRSESIVPYEAHHAWDLAAVTCITYLPHCPHELILDLYRCGNTSTNKSISHNEWPLKGGKCGSPMFDFSEIIITGHKDGLVRFWDATALTFHCLCKVRSNKIFESSSSSTNINNNDEDNNNDNNDNSSNKNKHNSKLKKQESTVSEVWHGVDSVLFCQDSRFLVTTHKNHVTVFLYSKKSTSHPCASIPLILPSDDNLKASELMKGMRREEIGWQAGFRALLSVCCDASLAVDFNSKFGLLSVGTSKGIFVVDIFTQHLIFSLPVHALLNPSPSADRSLTSSLKRSISRLSNKSLSHKDHQDADDKENGTKKILNKNNNNQMNDEKAGMMEDKNQMKDAALRSGKCLEDHLNTKSGHPEVENNAKLSSNQVNVPVKKGEKIGNEARELCKDKEVGDEATSRVKPPRPPPPSVSYHSSEVKSEVDYEISETGKTHDGDDGRRKDDEIIRDEPIKKEIKKKQTKAESLEEKTELHEKLLKRSQTPTEGISKGYDVTNTSGIKSSMSSFCFKNKLSAIKNAFQNIMSRSSLEDHQASGTSDEDYVSSLSFHCISLSHNESKSTPCLILGTKKGELYFLSIRNPLTHPSITPSIHPSPPISHPSTPPSLPFTPPLPPQPSNSVSPQSSSEAKPASPPIDQTSPTQPSIPSTSQQSTSLNPIPSTPSTHPSTPTTHSVTSSTTLPSTSSNSKPTSSSTHPCTHSSTTPNLKPSDNPPFQPPHDAFTHSPPNDENYILSPVISVEGKEISSKSQVIHSFLLHPSTFKSIHPPSISYKNIIQEARARSFELGAVEDQLLVVVGQHHLTVLKVSGQQVQHEFKMADNEEVLVAEQSFITNAPFLLTLLSTNHIAAFSLPSLHLVSKIFIHHSDPRSISISQHGLLVHLLSPSQLQKLIIAHPGDKDMTFNLRGQIHTQVDPPEIPRSGFFSSIFDPPSRFNRDTLFGDNNASGSASSSGHNSTRSVASLKQQQSSAASELSKAKMAALERGEKLSELEEKSQHLKSTAQHFGSLAAQIKNKQKKKWF